MEDLPEHCMSALSESAVNATSAATFFGSSNIFFMIFLAGLMGSVTHCLFMCGSIATLDAISCGKNCNSVCGKKASFARASGIFYHLGRMTTYGALGFFAALLSKQISSFPMWHFVAAVMLAIAGIMFIMSSLPNCKHFLLKASGKNSYLRGVMLGFLPCGLLYAALMMAATTANPFLGMFAMWCFIFGTIPIFVLANNGAKVLNDKWQSKMQRFGRIVMVLNGAWLLVMAARLVL
jgi:sulfite exporter TauE/SafE